MRKITIIRPKQWADRVRAYRLYVDGQPVGKIKRDEAVSLEIADDAQVFEAKVDWCSGPPVSLKGLSDGAQINVRNTFSHKLWIPFIPLWYSIFKRDQYLTIEVGEDAFF